MSDIDSPIYIVISAVFILAVSVIMLYANYHQWDAPRDLTTASTIATAYFVQALAKRIIRIKQAQQ